MQFTRGATKIETKAPVEPMQTPACTGLTDVYAPVQWRHAGVVVQRGAEIVGKKTPVEPTLYSFKAPVQRQTEENPNPRNPTHRLNQRLPFQSVGSSGAGMNKAQKLFSARVCWKTR